METTNPVDQQILPGLGNLRVRELGVGTIERHLRLIADEHGPAMAKMTKSVLSGVCRPAARHDALDRNPVRDTGSIEAPVKKAPKALTADEARTLLTEPATDEQARRNDEPDLVAFMPATGCRIGEATAVTWNGLDLDAGTAEIASTIVRVKGLGLVRKSTETASGARTLLLPRWCVQMLRSRACRVGALEDAARQGVPVFPAPLGRWRDPSNTQADLHAASSNAGFGHITSHVIRRRPRRCSITPACPLVPSPTTSATPTRASRKTSTSAARWPPPARRPLRPTVGQQ